MYALDRLGPNYFVHAVSFGGVQTSSKSSGDQFAGKAAMERGMKRTLIRYKTRPEMADANAELIKRVFEELNAARLEGVRYLSLRLDDDTFVHLVEAEIRRQRAAEPGCLQGVSERDSRTLRRTPGAPQRQRGRQLSDAGSGLGLRLGSRKAADAEVSRATAVCGLLIAMRPKSTCTIILAISSQYELWCRNSGTEPKVLSRADGSGLLHAQDFEHKTRQ